MCETELVCYPAHIIPDDDSSVGSEENEQNETPIMTISPDNKDNNMTPMQSNIFGGR